MHYPPISTDIDLMCKPSILPTISLVFYDVCFIKSKSRKVNLIVWTENFPRNSRTYFWHFQMTYKIKLFSMEEVLSNSDAVRTGWMILLAQLFISIIVALFIIRKARIELEKMLPSKNCQLIGDQDLNSVICEEWI